MSKYIDVYINQKSQFVSTSSHKYQLSWFLLNVQGTHATHVIDEARTQLVQSHVLLHIILLLLLSHVCHGAYKRLKVSSSSSIPCAICEP